MKNLLLPKKIFIVDDDPGVLESLEYLFKDAGYEVIAKKNYNISNNVLCNKKPDLILLDYWLPGKTGGEIAKKIKSDPRTEKIPVIIISASYNIKDMVFQCGANDFIPKPYDIDELLTKVKNYIDNRAN